MTQIEWEMVEDLINIENGLRDKEIDFIEDLYNDGDGEARKLSEKQFDWLKSIHERVCQ